MKNFMLTCDTEIQNLLVLLNNSILDRVPTQSKLENDIKHCDAEFKSINSRLTSESGNDCKAVPTSCDPHHGVYSLLVTHSHPLRFLMGPPIKSLSLIALFIAT